MTQNHLRPKLPRVRVRRPILLTRYNPMSVAKKFTDATAAASQITVVSDWTPDILIIVAL